MAKSEALDSSEKIFPLLPVNHDVKQETKPPIDVPYYGLFLPYANRVEGIEHKPTIHLGSPVVELLLPSVTGEPATYRKSSNKPPLE